MKITARKINTFLFFKLPLAWIGGVRVQEIMDNHCEVRIKHRWINQNPFRSMFWAAQGMAAEMSTGVLVIQKIQESGRKVSMLVTHQQGSFTKKATGKVVFECHDGALIEKAIQKTCETGEGQVVSMKSVGYDEHRNRVSHFEFQWSLKIK